MQDLLAAATITWTSIAQARMERVSFPIVIQTAGRFDLSHTAQQLHCCIFVFMLARIRPAGKHAVKGQMACCGCAGWHSSTGSSPEPVEGECHDICCHRQCSCSNISGFTTMPIPAAGNAAQMSHSQQRRCHTANTCKGPLGQRTHQHPQR